MEQVEYRNILAILEREMHVALGCTEPIAIAFAAAKAREVLGEMPECMEVYCSGNIVKNVKSVIVPNSGGMRGIEIAAILGVVAGRADKELEVLSDVVQADRVKAEVLLQKGFCKSRIKTGVDNLYVEVRVKAGTHSACVVVMYHHTMIWRIERGTEVLFQHAPVQEKQEQGSLVSLQSILAFARCARPEDLESTIGREIAINTAISDEGLKNKYGAQIGRTIREVYGDDIKFRAIAAASAGSDARMSGCSLPVMINSGSGNQGMTVSLPVLEYAKELRSSKEELYRALALSNLISIHIKKNIGDLSAFCGAVSAACGTGAAITFLHGGTDEQICDTIVNTIANVGGIVCDGAKASCAAKIMSAVNAAILGHEMSMRGIRFYGGDGIVQEDIEDTIRSVGYVGRVGMEQTDLVILKIMLGEISFRETCERQRASDE